MAKGNRYERAELPKLPETKLGTVRLTKPYESFREGFSIPVDTVLDVGRVIQRPDGIRSYKILGRSHWVNDFSVCDVKVDGVPVRRTASLYSAE